MSTTTDHNFQSRPGSDEFASYFGNYIAKVEGDQILPLMENQANEVIPYLNSISEEQASQLHEPYTWTIKQVIGHLIDAEKVFGYRTHRFAFGDSTELTGFDHDAFVNDNDYTTPTVAQLVDELAANRQANLLYFKRLDPACWSRKGTANGVTVSVRALAYIMVGHINHHLEIIKQRLAQ